jgi:hypothetical protein
MGHSRPVTGLLYLILLYPNLALLRGRIYYFACEYLLFLDEHAGITYFSSDFFFFAYSDVTLNYLPSFTGFSGGLLGRVFTVISSALHLVQ